MSTIMSGTAAPTSAVTALPPGLISPGQNFVTTTLPATSLRFDRLHARHNPPKPPASEDREAACAPSCNEGLPLAKRETLRRYGPNVLPLFYTARRSAPDQLEWEALIPHLPSHLTFGLAGKKQEIEPVIECDVAPGISVYSLKEFSFEPGVLYAWRVEPLDAPETAPPQEGRFWLLSEEERARCLQGCRALSEGGDRDFVALGIALFLTELELYQDALELIKRGPARAERDARVLLAHTAQALVYRQLGKNLAETRDRQGIAGNLSTDFLAWAANRERYHSDRASAQVDAAQAAGGGQVRTQNDRRAPRKAKIAA